jgi:uncharacterized protein (DUF3820 family)
MRKEIRMIVGKYKGVPLSCVPYDYLLEFQKVCPRNGLIGPAIRNILNWHGFGKPPIQTFEDGRPYPE